MHVVCVMFSRGLGGLEQSLLDYCEALVLKGHHVTTFIHPGAMIAQPLYQLSHKIPIHIEMLRNLGQWDPIAKQRMRTKLKTITPDAVITFGNRAASIAKYAAKGIAPIIARTPNYSVARIIDLDAIFHTTNHIKDHVANLRHPEDRLFHIPNMINVPEEHSFQFKPFSTPPIIGTMGRFVKKKGFADFIHALQKLDEEGIKFHALIGGEGEEEKELKDLVQKYQLQEKVTFPGWIENKKLFFDSIDIFCLPSLLEPFGIVLLEAFLHGKPVVTTNAEGPKEIAMHEHDALIVPKGNYVAMAEALKEMILDEPRAEAYAINALKTIKKRYDTKVVSEKMDKALKKIISSAA